MPKAKQYEFDWTDLAFSSKKPLKDLKATFISAPREISKKRFAQIVKEYLPQGDIVLGLAKEQFIDGFEGQIQFTTLKLKDIQSVIEKVNNSKNTKKIYTLNYFQREWVTVISKLRFRQILLINGSWKYAFHNSPVYYVLANEGISYKLISPFCDEREARAYERKMNQKMVKRLLPTVDLSSNQKYTVVQLLNHANLIAQFSYDYNFQTGAALGKKSGDTYKLLLGAHNTVVPFETYALHNGASREINFSPPHDLNYYDTVHAEVEVVLRALNTKTDLKGTSLFINLLPCPTCARMLCETEIEEVVYQNDHSDGYAVKLLEKAGKTVRRVVI